MKTIKLIFLLSIIFSQVNAQNIKKSFDNLATIKFESQTGGYIKFDSTTTTVINKQLQELDKNHPLYNYECDGDDILLVKTQIDKSLKSSQYIVYSPICSYGTFYILDAENFKLIGKLHGEQIVISGNSYIYLAGRLARNYKSTQKFIFENNKFREIKQPYYYVGIKSYTLRPVKIYQEKELINQVAYLPENYEIEVLLTEKIFGSELYLVKTSFGLVGWAKLEAYQYQGADVPEIYYWGD